MNATDGLLLVLGALQDATTDECAEEALVLLLLAMRKIEAIDHQYAVFGFALPVVFDDSELLQLGARDLPVQEVFFLLEVLLADLAHLSRLRFVEAVIGVVALQH